MPDCNASVTGTGAVRDPVLSVDVGGLSAILRLGEADLLARMENKLLAYGYRTIFRPGEYLIGVPKVIPPVALVAHVDTIRRKDPRAISWSPRTGIVLNKKGVLGADDRAGVYAITRILAAGYRPLVVFCDKEESGGVGAHAVCTDKALAEFAPDLRLLVEMDRRGEKDFVFYSAILPPEIKKLVSSCGWVESIGSYSDVATLTEEYLIPHVNVSAGYYNEHTPKEALIVGELEANIGRLAELLAIQNEIPKIVLEDDEASRWGSLLTYYRDDSNAWSFLDKRGRGCDVLDFPRISTDENCEMCDMPISRHDETVNDQEDDGLILCYSCRIKFLM